MKRLVFGSIISLATACGMDGGVISERLDKERYEVTAEVTNDSDKYVQVFFYNNGPHGGGCDSKSFKSFAVAPGTTERLTEVWWCSMEQLFQIGARLVGGEETKIDGDSAVIRCDDAGCSVTPSEG